LSSTSGGLEVAAFHGRGAPHERRAPCRADPNSSVATFGPKTRREFLALWDAPGGVPG
jgi:hypothetical protein